MASLHDQIQPFSGPCIRMDVEESPTAYRVQAELPGLDKGDIDVTVDGHVVSIDAELRHDTGTAGGKPLRAERFYGARRRTFALPQAIDAASASAQYADGVLSLLLPKFAGNAPRHILVH